MKISLCMPYTGLGIDRDRFLTWARKIDRGPFHGLFVGERLTGHSYEMRVLLAASAAVTERVKIHASLYILPAHSAVLSAKEMATLDVISDGRAIMSVGVGGRESDYRALGASFEKRNSRMDEQIKIVRSVWRGEPAFEGGEELGPRSPQGSRIPIYAGVLMPRAIARAAQWADGFHSPSMRGDFEGHSVNFERAKAAWTAAGRQGKPYLIGAFWYSLAPNAEATLKDYVFDYTKIGGEEFARSLAGQMTRHSEDSVLEAIDNIRRAGADEVLLVPASAHYDEIDRVAALVG